LATSIASDQVDGSQAQAIFQNQILGTFRQQISGLKTASVRDSRLKNQVADLQRIYDLNIVPQITAQQQRRANAVRFASIDSHLIPQFAGGGISRGGLAIMHPNEMVLTPTHQFAVRALAGSDIFERVGVPVPGVQPQRVFDNGGIMPSGPSPSWPATISIFVSVGITQKDAQDIVVHGLDGRTGEAIIIVKLDKSQTRGGRRFGLGELCRRPLSKNSRAVDSDEKSRVHRPAFFVIDTRTDARRESLRSQRFVEFFLLLGETQDG
jgi:hypothetical protein